jgi:transcriptional regulator with XRE-family HTH domain
MVLNRHALRIIRERSGLSVSALAADAGVSQPHLSNIESGRRQASPEVARRLAAALKVPLLALLADEEPSDGGADDEATSEAPPVDDGPDPHVVAIVRRIGWVRYADRCRVARRVSGRGRGSARRPPPPG